MAINLDDPARLHGASVHGGDGKVLGSVEAVYCDEATARPTWVAVVSGLFGNRFSLMPLTEADYSEGNLRVPYDKERLRTAPHHEPGHELSPSEEAELFRHYGIPYGGGEGASTSRTPGEVGAAAPASAGETTGAPGTSGVADDVGDERDLQATDDAMTRSEERLKAGTETHEAGRARLRKYVVTEQQQVTVPVSHEEVTVEHEPITAANRPAASEGPPISEAEHEVVLHEERPVTEKETVPVERVRLGTETVTGQETVGDEVRREEIDVEAEEHTVRDRERDVR